MENHPDINALIESTQSLECFEISETPTASFEKEFTIIARVLCEKTINMNAFKSTILKAWNPKSKVSSNLLQPNLMAFVFEDADDYSKILNLSWTFRDFQIITAKWPPDKALDDIDLNKATFWIQASGIPVCYTNINTAKFIGNTVGKFLKTDLSSAAQKWRKFLRIQVEIDILKPLHSSVVLSCTGRSRILIEIRYEQLSDFCFKCGLLGHKAPHCKMVDSDEDMDITTFTFGPWIKSENSHIPNPSFKAFNPLSTQISLSPSQPPVSSSSVEKNDKHMLQFTAKPESGNSLTRNAPPLPSPIKTSVTNSLSKHVDHPHWPHDSQSENLTLAKALNLSPGQHQSFLPAQNTNALNASLNFSQNFQDIIVQKSQKEDLLNIPKKILEFDIQFPKSSLSSEPKQNFFLGPSLNRDTTTGPVSSFWANTNSKVSEAHMIKRKLDTFVAPPVHNSDKFPFQLENLNLFPNCKIDSSPFPINLGISNLYPNSLSACQDMQKKPRLEQNHTDNPTQTSLIHNHQDLIPCDFEDDQVVISMPSNSLHPNRGRIFSIKRLNSGAPTLLRTKISNVVISEFNEGSSSTQTLSPQYTDPKGSQE